MSLKHRVQVLLDDERYRRVTAIARARGVSIATVVLEAVDRGLPQVDEKHKAAAGVLSAPPMAVGEPSGLSRELEELRGHRLTGNRPTQPG